MSRKESLSRWRISDPVSYTHLDVYKRQLFLLAIGVWVATSSALRAPPYVLLSRYAGRATLPRLAGIQLLGLAVASALAPYLAIVLKGVDPALPFLSLIHI